MCVNGTLVFRCNVTDVSSISFTLNGIEQSFFGSSQLNKPMPIGVFLVELVDVVDNTNYSATATIESVAAYHEGRDIECSDGTVTRKRSVSVIGML